MSKNKRKGLFGAPQNLQQRSQNSQGDASVLNAASAEFDSEQYHKVVQSELVNVLLIVVVVSIIFAGMWYSNSRHPWIDSLSSNILKTLVRGY